MKNFTLLTICIFLITAAVIPCDAADGDNSKRKKKERAPVVVVPEYNFEIPDMEAHLRAYEEAMESLDVQLGDLDVQLGKLSEPYIYNLEELQQLEDLHIAIPEINIEIPDIEPVVVNIPDINFHGGDISFYFDTQSSKLFKDLSEEEELRLQALRSVARQDVDKALPALEKTAKEDASPALRYEAVRQLGRFFEDPRVVPILGEVIKNDSSLEVRKKAIQLLGRSKDPRAVEILERIVGE